MDRPADVEGLRKMLAAADYLADDDLAVVSWLALTLERPLLVEGPAGTGKTDLARALAAGLSRELVRLQCYEGVDASKALYEWDYAKQMLYTQLLRDAIAAQTAGAPSLVDAADRIAASEATFFNERFLLKRPVLRAMTSEDPVVLLVDEIDRADPEFEALLLEALAANQVTLPELGTIQAKHPPLVVLTSNGARDMSDALRRRCLYAYLDYPTPSREQRILEMRVPHLASTLAEQLTLFTEKLRRMDLRHAPSIAETIDWGRSLLLLGANALDEDVVRATLGVLLKNDDDRETVDEGLLRLLAGGRS